MAINFLNNIDVSGEVKGTSLDINGNADISGNTVILSNLPTSDPGNAGQLWNDEGTLKISLG